MYGYLFVVNCRISVTALPDVLHVAVCSGEVHSWLNWFIDYVLLFWLRECRECKGEAHEPCDCETWKMWLKKVAEMKPEERKYWFCFFVNNMDAKISFESRYSDKVFVRRPSLIFTLLFHCPPCPLASGWCEWSLRGCCQLSVVALQRQTLRQLQVSHTEKWGLQPHAVCKGNFASYHLSQNSIALKEFVLPWAGSCCCFCPVFSKNKKQNITQIK